MESYWNLLESYWRSEMVWCILKTKKHLLVWGKNRLSRGWQWERKKIRNLSLKSRKESVWRRKSAQLFQLRSPLHLVTWESSMVWREQALWRSRHGRETRIRWKVDGFPRFYIPIFTTHTYTGWMSSREVKKEILDSSFKCIIKAMKTWRCCICLEGHICVCVSTFGTY